MTDLDLEISILDNDIDKVIQARLEGLNINEKGSHGNPLLYTVINNRKTENQDRYIPMLLEVLEFPNLDINIKNTSFGYCALHRTISDKNLKFAQILLDHGADINCQTRGLKTPLMLAIENSDLDATRLLLSRKPDLNKVDIAKQSALSLAVPKLFVSGFKLLLENGFNVALDDMGNVTIHSLCHTKNQEMMKLFCTYAEKNDVLETIDFQLEDIKTRFIKNHFSFYEDFKREIQKRILNKKLNETLEESSNFKKIKL